MVDEITPAVATAPNSINESAPAAPAAASENPSPVVVEAAVAPKEATASLPTETKVEPAKVEQPKPETLLGAEQKVEEKPAEVKPAEVKAEDAPVELPKYEWKLPEGVTVDDAKMGDFNKMLGDFQLSAKLPQEEVQKLGQQMLERHTQEMQRYTESLTQAWNKQKNDWKESTLNDPEVGGNRHNTALTAALDTIKLYAGNEEQRNEFHKLMDSTGVGNHPAMLRLLANIKLAKPEPTPLAAPLIATNAKPSKIERMYGKKSA